MSCPIGRGIIAQAGCRASVSRCQLCKPVIRCANPLFRSRRLGILAKNQAKKARECLSLPDGWDNGVSDFILRVDVFVCLLLAVWKVSVSV